MNQLTKLLKQLTRQKQTNRQRGKRTRRGATNRRYNFAGTAYSESVKPQRYGPGQTYRNIEAYFEAFKNGYFNLNSLLSGNTEHQTMCTLYNYFKIINIAITFFPAMSQPQSAYFNMQLNWNNQDDTNIPNEDNSKSIPIYRTRKYFFKFVPLNMPLLLGTSQQPVVLNMINYMRTSDPIVIPGCFNFTAETDFTARTRIVMRIEYRGSKIPDSTGLKKLTEKVEKSELSRPKIIFKEIKIEKAQQDDKKEEVKDEEDDDSGSEYEGDSEFIDDLSKAE
jgi:hypothetical protein